MAEQPWRNPRPTPQLREVQPRIRQLPLIVSLRAWLPAFIWATFIFSMSTDSFSSEHTGSIIEPILHWIYPAITAEQFALIHHLIRKTAHLTEYFIFGILVFRGVRRGRPGWRWSWALLALLIAAIYAAFDEFHQTFVPSRTASPYDSMIDTLGASAAILFLFLWFRWRAGRLQPASHGLNNT